MNDNSRQGKSGLTWVLSILGGVALLVLVVIGLAYYSGWLSNLFLAIRPPEYSARYYPDDTLLYAWFTLNPGDGQREQMQNMWEGLSEYSAFRDWTEDVQDSLLDEFDIDLEDHVLTWIGPEVSFAIRDIEPDSTDAEAAITIDVRDREAAEDFLLDFHEYRIEESGADYDRSSRGTFDIWADDRNLVFYALSDQLMVATTDERLLNAIIKRADGDDDSSLQENERFKAARDNLLFRRFSSVYVNGEKAVSILEDTEYGQYLDAAIYDEIPDWAAASAGWIEDGIVLDVVAPLSEEVASATTGVEPLSAPARLMPADTVAMLAFSFDPDVENWRDVLEEYDFAELMEDLEYMDEFDPSDFASDAPFDPANMNMAHVLDFGLMGFDILTGVDLERDFFAYLEGEMVIGVPEFDYEAVADDPEQNAVDAAALLSYRESDEADLSKTMEDLLDWLDSLGDLDIDETDVGARNEAFVVELRDVDYSPGYVLHDGYLTIATTEDMLERVVRLQNGEADSLAQDDEYRRAFSHLADNHHIQIYLDLQSLVEIGDVEDSTLSRSQVRFLKDILGSLAVVSTSDDVHERLQMVLTLFPENAANARSRQDTNESSPTSPAVLQSPAEEAHSSNGTEIGLVDFEEHPGIFWLKRDDTGLYELIANLHWVADGIDELEQEPYDGLVWLATDEPSLAVDFIEMDWFSDGLSEDEAWAFLGLIYVDVYGPDAEYATEMVSYQPWVTDGLDDGEAWALGAMPDILDESSGAARELMAKPWFRDGITELEGEAIEWLGALSYKTGSGTGLISMPFMESIEGTDVLALSSLQQLALYNWETLASPTEYEEFMDLPAIRDGITDEEAVLVVAGSGAYEQNPALAEKLLDPSDVMLENRSVTLPLAGSVDLVVVRTAPGAVRSMDSLENTVLFTEDYMGEAFPVRTVILLYADALDEDLLGVSNGASIIVHPDFDSDDGSLEAEYSEFITMHEVSHYYWHGSAHSWIDEGAAEFMSIAYAESVTGMDVDELLASGFLADDYDCDDISTLSDLERLSGARAESCSYTHGALFFLELRQALGPEEFRHGIRKLYHSGKNVLDPYSPDARNISHVRQSFEFSDEDAEEVIRKWYEGD